MTLGVQTTHIVLAGVSQFTEYEFARNAVHVTLNPGLGTGSILIKFASARQMGDLARLLLDMESEAIAQGCLGITSPDEMEVA